MNLVPYLKINDTEIANSIRTLTYLRRGLGGRGVGSFQVELCSDHTDTAPYSDLYVDIYSGDPFDPRDLCCYCRAIDGGPYKDPAYDNAPWYDPTRPESLDFLGLIPDVTLQPVNKRAVNQRSWGGATVGPVVGQPRVVQVTGTMYAASSAGMAYGENWLRHVLAGAPGGCGGDTLTIVTACPLDAEPIGATTRQLAAIGIVDGPIFSPEQGSGGAMPECALDHVAFQMVAGEPWLRKVTVLASGNLAGAGPICGTVTSGRAYDTGALITISALSALDGATISPVGVTIESMPPGVLVIDPTRRAIEYTNVAGVAAPPLAFTGILDFEKLMSRGGVPVTACVGNPGATGAAGATVTISAVDLES